MSGLDSVVRWHPTCCAWHGAYAEHPMRGGGVLRIKRDTEGALLVMRFDAENRVLDKSEAGEPAYVTMTEPQVLALLDPV